MEFETWLSANGFDPEALNDRSRTKLEAQWRAESQDRIPVAVAVHDGDDESEAERVQTIKAATETVRKKFARAGNVAKVKELNALAEMAIDSNLDTREFRLLLERTGRAEAVNAFSRSEPDASARVVEAAVCLRAGLPGIEKHFDARTLEASEHHFRNGLSLVGLLHNSAIRNGWRGMPDAHSKSFLQTAFGHQAGGTADLDLRAGTTGPSTYSLPNILGNIANKYLRAGYMGVDPAWSRIASKRSVNNFQTVTGVGLNGKTIYRTLAPSGEIKHAELTETTYTNRASTYAIMIGISRESLINDDAGAFTELSRQIGRGAAMKINDLFWTEFLDNSTFFASGNANVSTGGGSALGTADGAAINAAEQKFIAQTGADGYPIGVMPRIMLVPPTLANTARRWMGSFGFTQGGTSGLGDSNIYAGRYEVITSPYMESSALTGNSTAAWYLLADPNDVPVIEGVAVNGKWEPTVETGEADFNQLGIALRGFIDVGFNLYEYRGGVRSAGS